MSHIKIGAVSYLNTKPLVFGLEGKQQEFEILYDLPSRLADRLANRELDVALVPVVEAVSNPLYTIVSDACIACRGPVWSVKLFSRVELPQIKTLALDEGSRTSSALAKIILKDRFSVEPDCCKLPIDQPWQDSNCDAVLVIGDRAMKPLAITSDLTENSFQFELDLGEYWHHWTRLPFVFAVWAARPNTDLNLLDYELGQARDAGLEHVDEICRTESAKYGLTELNCCEYLTTNLHFRFGPQEKLGLNLFLEYAKRQGLVDQDLTLKFHDCPTVG